MAVCIQSTRAATEYPLTVFLCVVIVLSGLHKTYAAPTNAEDENEWWKNPCTKPTMAPIRHSRSAPESQLRIFIKTIDKFVPKRLADLYPNGSKSKLKVKGGCILKVGKLMRPIRTANNTKLAYGRFYSTMIQIAQYINKLNKVKVKTFARSDVAKRNSLYNFTKGNLRPVLCEFEDCLDKWDLTPPQVKTISTKCLPDSMDASSVLPRDIDFFNKLKKFFKQSASAIRKLRRKEKGVKEKNAKKH